MINLREIKRKKLKVEMCSMEIPEIDGDNIEEIYDKIVEFFNFHMSPDEFYFLKNSLFIDKMIFEIEEKHYNKKHLLTLYIGSKGYIVCKEKFKEMKIKKSFNFYSEIEFNNKFEYVYK
jgi:hypothetical protein